MFKKIIYIIMITFLVASCTDTFDSVKRGLTGDKGNNTDEFLVQKKDPLILPPDFENLPAPEERSATKEKIFVFEENLETSTENNSSSSSSVENSILRKIKSK